MGWVQGGFHGKVELYFPEMDCLGSSLLEKVEWDPWRVAGGGVVVVVRSEITIRCILYPGTRVPDQGWQSPVPTLVPESKLTLHTL